GAGVFHEYWRRPAETAASFAAGGWFKTGDVAVLEAGAFRLLGRSSTDILKTGGYKVSALEIESALAEHPAIAECAVVAVPDEEWGERVGAAVVLKPGARLSLEELRQWGAAHLAPYKLPTRLLELESLPRNALGKVVKPELARRFAGRRGAP
ncbi:MAG TPA: AMP-binding protein, partial [Thermoanaerobaculia bacterium]|nr:AMP-binding protein [Thermoanaerobaculia bacterium]